MELPIHLTHRQEVESQMLFANLQKKFWKQFQKCRLTTIDRRQQSCTLNQHSLQCLKCTKCIANIASLTVSHVQAVGYLERLLTAKICPLFIQKPDQCDIFCSYDTGNLAHNDYHCMLSILPGRKKLGWRRNMIRKGR